MEKYAVPNKLPSKQVTILAHRKRRIEAKQKELHKRHKKPKIVGSEGEKFRKPEFFVAEFRKAERDDKRIERAIMRHGISQKFMKDGELVFVMRHRGTHIASQQCLKLLLELGLKKMHSAVLLRFTTEVKAALSLVEPYVVYGTPNVSTVRDLIFKYGFMRYQGKKTAIKSNEQIEELFGKEGIICLEDVVHEIATVGPHFDTVKRAMYTFMLPNPKDGWIGKKGKPYKKGGIAGYRGDKINEFLKTIL